MIAERTYHHGNLKATCIDNGIAILIEEGIEKLTLRNVAKRSKVSHNAPYRSFKNKEELMIAIAQKIYGDLTDKVLKVVQHPSKDPTEDFRMMCSIYFDYATQNPVKYRFIAGSIIDHEGNFNNLTNIVTTAYNMVRNFLALHIGNGTFRKVDADQMAIHCIASIHGFCSIVIEHKLDLVTSKVPNYDQQLKFIVDQLLFILQENNE